MYNYGATKLECTFNYKAIMSNYVPIIMHNCFIIVSASDIPTDDQISTKNTSIDSSWWQLSTDVLFDHSSSSVRARDEKTIIGDNWQNQQLHTITHDYFANVQSNLAEPQCFSFEYNCILSNLTLFSAKLYF
jgi:hypothetical protein